MCVAAIEINIALIETVNYEMSLFRLKKLISKIQP